MSDDFKVLTFNNKKKQADDAIKPSHPDVIERLEEILTIAKKGGITDCFVVAAFDDEAVVSGWASRGSAVMLLSGIESAKIDFVASTIERSSENNDD